MTNSSKKWRRAAQMARASMLAWLRRCARDGSGGRPLRVPGIRPPRPGVPTLHFGARARAKARTMRLRTRLGLLGLIAAVIGLPGANAGWDLVTGALSPDRQVTAADLGGVTTSESAASILRFRRKVFQNRPTPTPTPTKAKERAAEPPPSPDAMAAYGGSVTEILYASAAEFGLDAGYLVSVASCESGLNPAAVNPAGYHGLFQFDNTTWAAYGYGSIYDATAQARTAARMLAAGMASRWPNCA